MCTLNVTIRVGKKIKERRPCEEGRGGKGCDAVMSQSEDNLYKLEKARKWILLSPPEGTLSADTWSPMTTDIHHDDNQKGP